MWNRTSEKPAEVALTDSLRAYRSSDYDSCIRHSARVLKLAEDDPLLVASVCWMRGGIEEMRGRRGLALRTWGYGLELARAAGLKSFEIYSLLERSISSLLEWPRLFLSHDPSDAVLAAQVRRALESHGLQCLEDETAAESAAGGSLLQRLDRVTVLLVLWSHAYRGSARRLTELDAAHGRLTIWRELGAAPRLLFVRADRTPIPRRFQEFETIDLAPELDAVGSAALERAVRHPGTGAAYGVH